MKKTTIILAVMGLASAGVIPLSPIFAPVATQYHGQDELGQFSYGYSGGPSAKDEIKTADGITRGGYAYVDANGLLQSAAYVSDPINGFRVAATNLPIAPAVPAVATVPAAVAISDSQAAIQAAPLLSTTLQQSSGSVVVDPAPVNEATADSSSSSSAEVTDHSTPAETPSTEQAATSSIVSTQENNEASIQQLITPIQDTVEVQAAKAAHLAAFEQVKLRDAVQGDGLPQEVHDAQENYVVAGNYNGEENSEEGEEPTEATAEGTETPAIEPSQPEDSPLTVQSGPETSPVVQAPVPIATSPYVRLAAPEASAVVIPSVATGGFAVAPIAVSSAAVGSPTVVADPIAVVANPAPTLMLSAPIASSPSGPVALEHVGQITSQYHSQDELGQYSYGYSGGPSAKHELKTADGLTSGGYSYIDSHGLVQTAAYISDPVNGFRVAATNIPTPRQPEYIPDSPEVEEAKQKLFKAQAEHIAQL